MRRQIRQIHFSRIKAHILRLWEIEVLKIGASLREVSLAVDVLLRRKYL